MKISVFGLGYVGTVTCAVLADRHNVIGVDLNKSKVGKINSGESPILEKGVVNLIKQGREKNQLRATTNAKEAILNSDVSVICVGTPSKPDGGHDLNCIHSVLKEISGILKEKNRYHLIVIRSTIPPKITKSLVTEYLGNLNIGVCFNPEFLREGSAVEDYLNPPYIVAACSDSKAVEMIKEFYEGVSGELILTSFEIAETVKILSNVFHALKISFANEVGRFCESQDINPKQVMELICRDKKLNISEAYLTPGFAYGGSCLPKDLRCFQCISKKAKLDLPIISSIDISNQIHINDNIKKIESFEAKKIGFIGLSFKNGTDDLRESPFIQIINYFVKRGKNIKVYDKDVPIAKLVGTNKQYIENIIPHINTLLVKDLDSLNDCELIVLGRDIDKTFDNKKMIHLV